MTFYIPVQYLLASKRGSIADSDLRAAWLAELKECDRRRTSLIRRAKRARRSGDRRKFADLNKQLWEMASVEEGPPPPGWPTPRFVTLMDRTYEDRNGWLMKDEWDKTVPRRLRNENGRTAWVTLSYWRRASEREKRNLEERLRKSGDDASRALYNLLKHLERENGEFFSKLEIAFQEEKCSCSTFEKMKEELILYRASLNWSRTPGQKRHTIAEIKQIVAPGSSIKLAVFRNMIREFDVPYLKVKRGKGSPNYRLAAAGAHQ